MKRQTTVEHLRRQDAEHLAPYLLNPVLEFHVSYDLDLARDFLPADDDGQRRIDAAHDHGPLPAPIEFATIGSNGVDDDGMVHWIGGDIDGSDHEAGHDDATIERVVGKLQSIDYLQVNRSRGGHGLHFYCPLATPIIAPGRKVSGLRDQLVRQIAAEIDEPLADYVDATSGMMFFWSPNRNPQSYELLKSATAKFTGTLTAPASTNDWYEDFGNITPAPPDRQAVQSALRALKPEHADDYATWIKVGMILRTLGDDYLPLWTEWSQQSKQFRNGCTNEKWPTFKATADAGDVTAATLFKWADDDGWRPSAWHRPHSAMVKEHKQRRPWVVEGIARVGDQANIVAAPKIGKSFFGVQLALSIESGSPFLGKFPTIKGRVLLIDNEVHGDDLTFRISDMQSALQIQCDLEVAEMRGKVVDINKLAELLEQEQPGTYVAIIIDALYRSLPNGIDENDNAAMTQVYNRLDAIARRMGAAVFVVHHVSKGSQVNKEVHEVGSGAGSQSRATDNHLTLRTYKNDDGESTTILDSLGRSTAKMEPFCLDWSYPVWTISDKNPDDFRTKRKSEKNRVTREQVIELCPAKPIRKETFIAETAVALNESSKRIRTLIDSAVGNHLLSQTKEKKSNAWLVSLPKNKANHDETAFAD